MDNNLFEGLEETGSTTHEPVIDLSGLTDQKRERREKFSPIWICTVLFLVLVALVYYYLGDPLHILGFTPHNYEQGLVQEASPIGAVDAYVLSLGDADCTVFLANRRTCMMVDAGTSGDFTAIDSFLKKQNVDKLEVLVATHADDAHTGAMLSIMQQYTPELFVCPAVYPESSSLADCVSYASQYAIKIAKIGITPSDSGPSVIDWAEDTEVLCLSPFSGTYSADDDYSIIMRVRYGETSMLLSGDAGSASERIAVKMLPNRYFHSNIVVLGNHGRNGSSCEKYLSTCKATIAIASCGSNGPDQEVISLVKQRGMNLYRTDRNGTIHLRLDGVNASVVE